MRPTSLFLLQLSAALAVPTGKRAEYELFSEHPAPRGWQAIGRPNPNHVINLRIGLKQSSFDELERQLYEVSDPHGSQYGEHLSAAQVESLIAPSPETHDSVHDWLAEHSVTSDDIEYSPARDWLVVALPLWQVEKMLDTEYQQYDHLSGKQIVRTTKYSLPRYLHDHIDVIQPTNYFGNWKLNSEDVLRVPGLSPLNMDLVNSGSAVAAVGAVPTSCATSNGVSTLQCYRDFYGTTSYTPKVPSKNWVATTNYLGQVPSTTDFTSFMTSNRPGVSPGYAFNTVIIANASNDQTMPGVEADLDVELVGGFAVPTNFTTYSTGGSPPYTPDLTTPTNTNEPYLTWLQYVLKQSSLPYVITTSYGDDEQTVPITYAKRVCKDLSQLGARGITVLFSSGDFGVGTAGDCKSNDGKNTTQFLPAFPASCPFVTSVGGTRDYSPEQVAFDTTNGYVSGSGFSNYFKRPKYQNKVVTQYLKSIGSLNAGLFNRAGRAYPDISAQSYRFLLFYTGAGGAVDGTSVASPLTAGILTLVNDALIAAGKKPLGFLNPLLYSSNGLGFNDVSTGNSTGCGTSGFPARAGWDVASGWGTPNFPAITAALGV